MDFDIIRELLTKIKGTTFANLDATCEPKPGLKQRITGERVLLYNTHGDASVYEGMIRRRLLEAGKDPMAFHVGPLPWGERVSDSPLIQHKGKFFVQYIILAEGQSVYYLAGSGKVVDPTQFGVRPRVIYQAGLPKERQVHVRCINIENIDRLTMFGETIFSDVTGNPDGSVTSIGN